MFFCIIMTVGWPAAPPVARARLGEAMKRGCSFQVDSQDPDDEREIIRKREHIEQDRSQPARPMARDQEGNH